MGRRGTRKAARSLRKIYKRLYEKLGPQHWWPGDTPFEVMIGAILTQNTSWSNVEKAIENLKKDNLLSPAKMQSLTKKRLARIIKPSGFFNVKAVRIISFLGYLKKRYKNNISAMKRRAPGRLRAELLSVKGIGRETADSILLYALGKPVFVVDAYTKRILSRHGLAGADWDYDDLQRLFADNLPRDSRLYNEYHALIVSAGKNYCRPGNPKCGACPLGN
ncbi:MAG: endonuclease III domain-containing protein [Candidatus Omnitrophota bacterium]